MSCLPGMPCFPITYSFYPPGCEGNSVFKGYPIVSTLLCYAGPVLPNSGINPGDSVSLALAKLDNEMSPSQLVANLIAGLESNPSLLGAFCSVISACNTTSTTTTIQTPTPAYIVSTITDGYGTVCDACSDNNFITTVYSNASYLTPVHYMIFYTDPEMTNPVNSGGFWFRINWGGPIHTGWDVLIQGSSDGINIGDHCSSCLTTTTTTVRPPYVAVQATVGYDTPCGSCQGTFSQPTTLYISSDTIGAPPAIGYIFYTDSALTIPFVPDPSFPWFGIMWTDGLNYYANINGAGTITDTAWCNVC